MPRPVVRSCTAKLLFAQLIYDNVVRKNNMRLIADLEMAIISHIALPLEERYLFEEDLRIDHDTLPMTQRTFE
jgi:hypothetical protein